MIKTPVELFTDGSSLHNPGPSGLGYIIRYYDIAENDPNACPQEQRIEGAQGFRLSTNNRMEIMSVIYGIRHVLSLVDSNMLIGTTVLNIMSDSEYVCNCINKKWIDRWVQNNWMTSGYKGSKPTAVKNRDLWEQIIDLQGQLRSRNIVMTITHVEGHAGNELNERADQLATSASGNSLTHIVDEVYEAQGGRRNYR